MQNADNVIQLKDVKNQNQQELIDHLGAQAFEMLRDSAEAMDLPMKTVIAEHILGLSLVMASVDGKQATKKILEAIAQQVEHPQD